MKRKRAKYPIKMLPIWCNCLSECWVDVILHTRIAMFIHIQIRLYSVIYVRVYVRRSVSVRSTIQTHTLATTLFDNSGVPPILNISVHFAHV